MRSNRELLSKDLLRSLNPNGWPIRITDFPSGSALVGGSIRDGLLNKLSHKPDLDFVLPINAINFTKKLATKINATFVRLDESRDIARLVVDGWTLDFARQVGENLKDDLFRRDFRINAIALRLGSEPQLFDPTGGIDDINVKKIVAINEKNLIEDPLRIIRGFRLMCELNFELEKETKRLLKTNVNKLITVSPERIKTEILKIVNVEWNDSYWKTYLELQLFKNWNDDNITNMELNQKQSFSKELKDAFPLARLICLISDDGLSELTFSKNQIQRCRTLRFWIRKINNFGLEKFSEEERFQLHVDLEEDLPSLILFLKNEYVHEWLKRWKDPADPLFHPSSPVNGHLLQRALMIPPGPALGELMRYLAKEKAFSRLFTNQEALKAARKWALENSPFL